MNKNISFEFIYRSRFDTFFFLFFAFESASLVLDRNVAVYAAAAAVGSNAKKRESRRTT